MKRPALFHVLSIPLILLLCGLCCSCGKKSANASAEPTLFSSTSRIRTMDPARAGDVSSSLAVGHMYEGLLQYDYTARPYRLRPLLAEDLPEISENGMVFRFNIRRGIRFHDDPCFTATQGKGREVTAHDFIYSLKRMADAKTSSTGFWTLRHRIVGLDDFREASQGEAPTDYTIPVAGLQAIDDYTLQITCEEPYPQLVWVLAMIYGYVIPHEAVAAYGREFSRHPVGTGPYQLVSWQRNYRVEYKANPDWTPRLPEIQNKNMPQIKRIVQSVMDDATTRWLAFLKGELDFYSDISRDYWDVIFTPGLELSRTMHENGINLYTIPSLNIYYIGFNMDDSVVGANKKLRQALSCAFNTDEWLSYYNGRIRRAYGPIPPGVAGHTDGKSALAFNLDKARTLLAEAGYPDGIDPETGHRLELTLELGQTDTEMRESTELIVDFFDQMGVLLKPSYNNKPAFFKKIEKRQAQMFRLSWFADYPDGQNFLQLFYSANASPGPNRVNYVNHDFDTLYRQASTMQDTPERTALYQEMADIVKEDCPWIFMHFPVDYALTRDCIQNFIPSDFPYGMDKYLKKTTTP